MIGFDDAPQIESKPAAPDHPFGVPSVADVDARGI
jgi:hypothetical protein